MSYKPKIHHRKSLRLPWYDYSSKGAYFVTINSHHRKPLFGEIQNGKMILSKAGIIAVHQWRKIPKYMPNVEIDQFVIMPDHMHGIIIFTNHIVHAGAVHEPPLHEPHPQPRRIMGLPRIIGHYKMISSKHINLLRNTPGIPVWQRNYFECIIKSEKSINRIRRYIVNNPRQWGSKQYR